MRQRWLYLFVVCILLGPSVLFMSAADPADPGITLLGQGTIPGNALDLSGLEGDICNYTGDLCQPRATFGGFGSALTYTGHDDVYLAVPDRGPFDGRTEPGSPTYLDRFHFLQITVKKGGKFPNITTNLLDTRFFKNEKGQNFTGSAFAFSNTNPLDTLRLDPEGVTIGPDGTFFISDEYGPYIFNFDRQGHLRRRVPVPAKFALDLFHAGATGHQSGEIDSGGNSLELYPDFNHLGRQANRGMEGLTITPDGRTLVGMMQNALLQDNALILDANGLPSRQSVNNRILTIDLVTGETHEYIYTLDASNQGRGTNEILAINNHEFLVLERDNRTLVPTPVIPPPTAQNPNLKSIFKVDLNEAGVTDVKDIVGIPASKAALASATPPIVPLTKTVAINLLNSNYVVGNGKTVKDVIAEKIEGLAWGPDLPNGHHVLYVISDNDLYSGYLDGKPLPTQIYAFEIDGAAAGIDYQPATLPGPMFPPGQLKKILTR